MDQSYAPQYSEPFFPYQTDLLVNGSSGVLGLGLRRLLNTSIIGDIGPFVVKDIQRFSMYLAQEDEDIDCFVYFNAVDSSLIEQKGYNAVIPLSHLSTSDSRANGAWVSFFYSIQFNTNSPPSSLYELDTNGSWGGAIFSVGTPVVEFPARVFFSYFRSNYLADATCTPNPNAQTPRYYVCERGVIQQLPRVSINIDRNVFVLDPVDYTRVSKTNSSMIILDLVPSAVDDGNWVFGVPFLRKFPPVPYLGPACGFLLQTQRLVSAI